LLHKGNVIGNERFESCDKTTCAGRLHLTHFPFCFNHLLTYYFSLLSSKTLCELRRITGIGCCFADCMKLSYMPALHLKNLKYLSWKLVLKVENTTESIKAMQFLERKRSGEYLKYRLSIFCISFNLRFLRCVSFKEFSDQIVRMSYFRNAKFFFK